MHVVHAAAWHLLMAHGAHKPRGKANQMGDDKEEGGGKKRKRTEHSSDRGMDAFWDS